MANQKPSVLEKPCLYCGKVMLWEKSLQRFWEDLKYCGTACRRKANREARREDVPEAPEAEDDALPPILTQRFNRPRRKVTLKKR